MAVGKCFGGRWYFCGRWWILDVVILPHALFVYHNFEPWYTWEATTPEKQHEQNTGGDLKNTDDHCQIRMAIFKNTAGHIENYRWPAENTTAGHENTTNDWPAVFFEVVVGVTAGHK